MDTIVDIRNMIRRQTEEEYEINNFVPNREIKKYKRKPIADTKINYDIAQYKQKLNSVNRKNNKTKEGYIEKNKMSTMTLDSLDNNFNIIEEENEYIEWRKLPDIEKKKKVVDFIEQLDLENSIKNKLTEELKNIIDDGYLTKKMDIVYDKINSKIINIPYIILTDTGYIFKSDSIKSKSQVKTKSRKKTMNKIFKKK